MTVRLMKTAEARARWREILDAAQAGQVDTVIERNGKPVAVVIPHEDYIRLREELEDLWDARLALRELAAWEADPSAGKDWDELKVDLIVRSVESLEDL